MMVAFWQVGAAANLSEAGCWDVSLVSITTAAATATAASALGGQCPGATPPATNTHCDLQKTNPLDSGSPAANYTACADRCCAASACR